MDPIARRVHDLLDAIIEDFPRRKAEAEDLMRQIGLDDELVHVRCEVVQCNSVPVFEGSSRPLSPMLAARYSFAGRLQFGQDIWITPVDVESLLRDREVMASHEALRNHWENSAPMQYGDEALSIFAYTDGVPEDRTYLAWPRHADEPEVWDYSGYQERQFSTLVDYLEWELNCE